MTLRVQIFITAVSSCFDKIPFYDDKSSTFYIAHEYSAVI